MAFDKNRAICWRDPLQSLKRAIAMDPLQSLKRTIAMSAAYDEVDESPAKQPRAFEFHIYVDDSQDQTRAFEVNDESQHAFEESQVVPKFSDVMEELERDHIDDIAPEEEALEARPLQAVNFADVLQDLDREPDETLEDIDAVIQEEPFDLCEEARDDGPEIHGEGEDSYYMEGEGEDSDVEDEDAKIALQQLHIHRSLHMIMKNVERDDAVTLEAKLRMLEHMIHIIDNIEDSDEDVAPPGMEEKEDVVSPGMMEEKDQQDSPDSLLDMWNRGPLPVENILSSPDSQDTMVERQREMIDEAKWLNKRRREEEDLRAELQAELDARNDLAFQEARRQHFSAMEAGVDMADTAFFILDATRRGPSHSELALARSIASNSEEFYVGGCQAIARRFLGDLECDRPMIGHRGAGWPHMTVFATREGPSGPATEKSCIKTLRREFNSGETFRDGPCKNKCDDARGLSGRSGVVNFIYICHR